MLTSRPVMAVVSIVMGTPMTYCMATAITSETMKGKMSWGSRPRIQSGTLATLSTQALM